MGKAIQRTLHHHVERGFCLCHPAHAMRKTSRPEPVLTKTMSIAATTKNLRIMDTQVFNDYFRVSCSAVHGCYFAYVIPALAWQVDDEGCVCATRTLGHIHLCTSNQDCKLCASCTGDKPLVSVENPLVTIFNSVCANQRWVRSSNFWFGHRETRRGNSVYQGLQIFFFLLVGRPVEQRVHVSFVGSLAVKHPWPHTSSCSFSLHHCEGNVTKPHATPLFWHVWQPETYFYGLFTQTNQLANVVCMHLRFHVVAMTERFHGWLNDIVDEVANLQANCFVFWCKGEINHGVPPIDTAVSIILMPRDQCLRVKSLSVPIQSNSLAL